MPYKSDLTLTIWINLCKIWLHIAFHPVERFLHLNINILWDILYTLSVLAMVCQLYIWLSLSELNLLMTLRSRDIIFFTLWYKQRILWISEKRIFLITYSAGACTEGEKANLLPVQSDRGLPPPKKKCLKENVQTAERLSECLEMHNLRLTQRKNFAKG